MGMKHRVPLEASSHVRIVKIFRGQGDHGRHGGHEGVANSLGRVHAKGRVKGRRFRRGNASGIDGHDPGSSGGI